MFAFAPIVLALQVTVGVRMGQDTALANAAKRARAETAAAMEEAGSDRKRPVRRAVVTAELRRTAYRDEAARTLILRARSARLLQDSLLRSYDATTYQRISVGLGFKVFGRDRLAMRHEEATRVQWDRTAGAIVDVKGSRSVVPIAKGLSDSSDTEMTGTSSLPYYPGKEELWIGGSQVSRDEVDEREFVNPLKEGAEAYYFYETGDSVFMNLPDGKTLTLREIRIVARQPKWNVSVGSFWFDEGTAHLVRAVYRLSVPLDVWGLVDEQAKLAKADSAGADTLATGRIARGEGRGNGRGGPGGPPPRDRNRNNDGPPALVKAIMSPMKVEVSAITIEYGLYNQRFWLPRANAMEGMAQAGFMRIPITLEEKIRYAGVNALDAPITVPPITPSRLRVLRDSLEAAKSSQVVTDSLMKIARKVRVKELQEKHERECKANGFYTSESRRGEGSVPVFTRTPCDAVKLANSPDLPPSIYDPGDVVFGSADRDQLVKALTMGLQSGWAPQMPRLEYGLAYTRYNRVEGFGTGLGATMEFGRGYAGALRVRGSVADRTFNGELGMTRSNGRATIGATVYRRLGVMNDYGTPLSFGASLANLLYARDEGAYYRNWGAEIHGESQPFGRLEWRLFGEQQWKADVNTRWSLFGGANDDRFLANPAAQKATVYGGAARLVASAGLDPNGWRSLSDLRLEAAGGDYQYVRGLADLTVSHSLGVLGFSLNGAAGYTTGSVPVQRKFYLGGLQTVRGQTGLTASGDAFWMARAELGLGNIGVRPVVFGDIGWAGDRKDFSNPGRPMSGAGAGISMLDGLIRMDLARGLYPAKQWRFDVYLEAKF